MRPTIDELLVNITFQLNLYKLNSQFSVFLDLPGDLYVNRGRRLHRVSVGMIVGRRSKDTHRILLETLNFEEKSDMIKKANVATCCHE